MLALNLNRNLLTNAPHAEEPLIKEVTWKLTFSPIQTSSPTAVTAAERCFGATVTCDGTVWRTLLTRTTSQSEKADEQPNKPNKKQYKKKTDVNNNRGNNKHRRNGFFFFLLLPSCLSFFFFHWKNITNWTVDKQYLQWSDEQYCVSSESQGAQTDTDRSSCLFYL